MASWPLPVSLRIFQLRARAFAVPLGLVNAYVKGRLPLPFRVQLADDMSPTLK